MRRKKNKENAEEDVILFVPNKRGIFANKIKRREMERILCEKRKNCFNKK